MTLDPTAGDPNTIQHPATDAHPFEAVQSPAPRRRSATILNVVLGVAVAVAVGGAAFAVGRASAPTSARGAFANGQFPNVQQPTGSQAPGAFGGRGLSIEGSVVSIDADSMTIRTASGTTIDVALDGSTAYHQQSDTTASSVTTGSDVVVRLTGGGRPGQAPGSSAAPTGTASDITVVP